MPDIAIIAENNLYIEAANSLSSELNLPTHPMQNPKEITEFSSLLIIGEQGISLQECGKGAPGPVYVDFVGGVIGHRIKYGGGKGQMIAKAIGIKNLKNMHVLDATAGLGRDGFILASMGCNVTMVERCKIVATLLEDGLKRALESDATFDIANRITLIKADAIEYINSTNEIPDVIYLDPMFPSREKSALVKKEMRIFKKIVGDDADAANLLNAAKDKAKYRVVVKRPRKSEDLGNCPPSFTIEGKANRFDIYTKQKF